MAESPLLMHCGICLLSACKLICFMAAGPLADGLVAFACSQEVSEPVSWLQVLLLMVLWHLPALSK